MWYFSSWAWYNWNNMHWINIQCLYTPTQLTIGSIIPHYCQIVFQYMYASILSAHLLVIPLTLLPFLGCYDQCCNAYSLQILLHTGLIFFGSYDASIYFFLLKTSVLLLIMAILIYISISEAQVPICCTFS